MINQDTLLQTIIEEAYKFDINNGYVEDFDDNNEGNYFEITDIYNVKFECSMINDKAVSLNYPIHMIVEECDPYEPDWPYNSYTFTLESMMCLVSKDYFTHAFKESLWVVYNEMENADLENSINLSRMISKKDKKALKGYKSATIKLNAVTQMCEVLEIVK